MAIRALIVDDERLARSRVQKLLETHDDIQVVGESRNGAEAIDAINTLKPDLIFLDVQMPDLDGFAVLAQADIAYAPFVIFATAFDRYALKAFDVHAVDYLLKPFDEERFDESLERARQQIKMRRTSEFNHRLLDLVRDYHGAPAGGDEVFEIKERSRFVNVAASDIFWVEADGNYVELHTKSSSHLYRTTMKTIADRLDPSRFLRIHRSFIVNVTHVKEVRYLNRNNEFEFRFRDGRSLTSARSYRDTILQFVKHTPLLKS